MKKNIKIFVALILTALLFVFVSQIISMIINIKTEAVENANQMDAHIISAIDDSINLLSVEGKYEEIITTNQTWIMGLNPSIAWVKIKGTIKVGSKIMDVSKEGNKYVIKLSEPEITDHDPKPDGLWVTEDGFLNNFDITTEGKIITENKKLIEDQKFDELKQRCIENNKQIIQSFFDSYGKEYEVEINYIKG